MQLKLRPVESQVKQVEVKIQNWINQAREEHNGFIARSYYYPVGNSPPAPEKKDKSFAPKLTKREKAPSPLKSNAAQREENVENLNNSKNSELIPINYNEKISFKTYKDDKAISKTTNYLVRDPIKALEVTAKFAKKDVDKVEKVEKPVEKKLRKEIKKVEEQDKDENSSEEGIPERPDKNSSESELKSESKPKKEVSSGVKVETKAAADSSMSKKEAPKAKVEKTDENVHEESKKVNRLNTQGLKYETIKIVH